MSHSDGPIARAIAELETERQNLQARLTKVDDAIVCLRKLFHLPSKPLVAVAAPGNGRADLSMAILAALREKPLSPSELAIAVGTDTHTLRMHVVDLERAGKIVSTGATISRRIALVAPVAKEALRR